MFNVDGKKKKILYGLEAPEAEPILRALSHLGIDTVHDPGMPMIIEMALERRKSRFGLL
jgi:phosphoribosylformylglycinamidine (FGAM) synthase PurS component